MKKIGIYLERKPESGGAYQYSLAMLTALALFPRNDFEITAFCTYSEWKNVTKPLGLETEIVRKKFPQKVLHFLAEKTISVESYRKYCRYLHPLARRFLELKIDACIYPCGDKISFMLDTPAIITVFDLMHRYLLEFPEIADKKILKSRERSYHNIAKYAKMIFVDSKVGKEQMMECYGNSKSISPALEKRIKVLPMIAPDYIYQSIGQEKYPKPDVFEQYIFYPAQLWKHKNHIKLLQAIAQLKIEGIVINLVISGSGKNAHEEVMQVIEQNDLHNQVQILGYVTNQEMIALYQHAKALVMPTFGGPTNIPQLEAFALGCPVATSDIFGIPEQVGDAALLFNPNSVEEIKECIVKLWNDNELCNDLIEKGYRRSREWGQEQYREKLFSYLQNI